VRARLVTPRLDDLDQVTPASRSEWRAWLAENHAASPGVWLAVGKSGNRVTALTYDDAVEEALCFGWIDSTVHALDADRFLQFMTPRKRGSGWARSNKERVARLTEAGLMQPSGIAAVEAAMADGSWSTYDHIEAMTIPADLAAAFDADAAASAGFSALSESARKMALYWIATAKRPETRAKRIAATVESAVQGRPPV